MGVSIYLLTGMILQVREQICSMSSVPWGGCLTGHDNRPMTSPGNEPIGTPWLCPSSHLITKALPQRSLFIQPQSSWMLYWDYCGHLNDLGWFQKLQATKKSIPTPIAILPFQRSTVFARTLGLYQKFAELKHQDTTLFSQIHYHPWDRYSYLHLVDFDGKCW